MTRRKTEADFWRHVEKRGNGCWAWKGGKASGGQAWQPGGFFNGERLHARRIAWALVHGEVPERMLQPACGDRLCINPEHARAGLLVDDVPDILEQMAQGLKHDAIAQQYGVHRCTLVKFLSRHRAMAP